MIDPATKSPWFSKDTIVHEGGEPSYRKFAELAVLVLFGYHILKMLQVIK